MRKPDDGTKKKEKKEKEKRKQGDGTRKKDGKKEASGGWEVAPGINDHKVMSIDPISGAVKIFPNDVDINAKNVVQKLAEINTQRPRKESDRKNKVVFLQELRRLASTNDLGLGLDLKIRLSVISALYEYNPKHKDYMSDEAFKEAAVETQSLINSLLVNRDIVIMTEEVSDDDESITDKPNEDGKWHVRGSLVNTCTKLDTEFYKLLQNSDQHSEEYRERLKSDPDVINILKTGVEWAEMQSDEQQRCQMYLLVIKPGLEFCASSCRVTS